ncbi:MAG: DEAD/DEAH box helicase [Rhodospirillaceae bacterium]
MSFSDLGLSPETLRAVEDSGYNTPTPIQEQAIPWVLMGRDVLGIAQTGTGKTASFTLPMIDVLASGRAKARMPRSLILAPTRELANQVAENFTKYGKYQKLTMALLIGGESFVEQNKVLERGVDVLIATPGRLMDMFDRGKILLRDVKILVIDEADRMLDMGFIPDVERIVGLLPPLRQTLFFSATMDKNIRKLADAFLHNPKEVKVDPGTSAAETVTQQLVVVDHVEKRAALRHVIRMEDVRNAFIFCNRKRDVGMLYKSLTKHGFDVAQLHGDMPQSERTATLARFKAGEVRLMVCSDVAARGIDIADVSHVFNFDVPIHSEDYVHRIGRTGRAGREGRAYTIATPDDARFVAAIEKLVGKEIPRIVLEGLETKDLSAGDGERTNERSGSDRRPGARRRGRDRGGRASRDTAERPAEAAVEPVSETVGDEPTDVVVEAPAPAVQAAEPVARDRGRDRSSERNGDRNGDHRRERGSERGGERTAERGGDRQRRARRFDPAWTDVEEMRHGDDVLAFGDHAPAFLFAPTTGTEARAAEEAARASRGETAPAQKPRRSRKPEPVDEPAAEPVAEPVADGEADAVATEAEAPAEAAPKPKRTRPARTRKIAAKASEAVPADEATAAVAVAEMPEAPEPGEAAAPEEAPAPEAPVTEAPAKPKRVRAPRAKKAATATADAEAAVATEEKPKRTRAARTKKAAEPTAEDTTGNGEAASE